MPITLLNTSGTGNVTLVNNSNSGNIAFLFLGDISTTTTTTSTSTTTTTIPPTTTTTSTTTTTTTTPFINPTVSIGSAVQIVSQSPFVGGGNSYQFSSNINSFIDTPGSSDWAVGTGDFTVEWFTRQTSAGSFPRTFSVGSYSTAALAVSIEGGTFYYWANSGVRYSNAAGTILNTWVHWAVVRQNNITKVYKNGSLLGSQITDNNNVTNNSTALTIGNETIKSTGSSLIGYLTNFRWVKGLAVYTGNFTTPTSALTDIANANPYGGSNTQAIPAGYTKLLLVP